MYFYLLVLNLIFLYSSIKINTVDAIKNKSIKCGAGTDAVCNNFDNIGTSITIICSSTDTANATIIKMFDFNGILKAEFFSLLLHNYIC